MSKSGQAACLNIETDLEKTAEHYDRSIVAGWEGLYARMRGAFWHRADRLVGPSARVLELGCGDGEVTGHLARSCEELVVVDGSNRMLDMSRDRIGDLPPTSATVSFVHSWFEEYNPDEAFDLVVMAHILEHMDEPIELLRRATRWLRPGGRLLALVPNAGSLHRRVAVHMGLLERPDSLNPQDQLLGHRRVYWPESFRADIAAGGWDIEHFGGIMVKPVTNRMIEKDWSVEMIDGFIALGDELPELSAEIYVVAKLGGGS